MVEGITDIKILSDPVEEMGNTKAYELGVPNFIRVGYKDIVDDKLIVLALSRGNFAYAKELECDVLYTLTLADAFEACEVVRDRFSFCDTLKPDIKKTEVFEVISNAVVDQIVNDPRTYYLELKYRQYIESRMKLEFGFRDLSKARRLTDE